MKISLQSTWPLPLGTLPRVIPEKSKFYRPNTSIQRITMCPHGYHHNGFMATPALGTQEVRLYIIWIAL